MRKPYFVILALLILVLAACAASATPTPLPTPTPTPEPTSTPIPPLAVLPPAPTPFVLPSPTPGVVTCEENISLKDRSSDATLTTANLVKALESLGLCVANIEITMIDGNSVDQRTITGAEASGYATSFCTDGEFTRAEIILAVSSREHNQYETYRGETAQIDRGWMATVGILHELYHVYQAVNSGCEEIGIEGEYEADDWALENYKRFDQIIYYVTPMPTPAVAPLEITLRNIHYEQYSAQGGRYLWVDWIIYNRSSETVFRVWRPAYEINDGRSFWAGYYDCDFGWPQGSCYRSLTEDQPNIEPGKTITFIWYHITDTADQWVQYASLEVLGWRFVFEFDPAGNIIGQDAYPISWTPETPPGDYD